MNGRPPALERAHVCEGCGETFIPRRSDARFCSPACRSARWRPIVHHAADHQPGGFPLKPNRAGYPGLELCLHQLPDGEFCRNPATWRHDTIRNSERGVVGTGFYCDEHAGAHVPKGVVIGEPIRDVVVRDGREARRRHGIPAPERNVYGGSEGT